MRWKQALTDEDAQILFVWAAKEGPLAANNFFDFFLDNLEEAKEGKYAEALDLGQTFLTKVCLSPNKQAYREVYKGAAFYRVGTLAFLANDYEAATFFYNAAVNDDLAVGADPRNNPTPALDFISLQANDKNHLALPLIESVQDQLAVFIDHYNTLSQQTLTLEAIRYKFLYAAMRPSNGRWRPLTTALISFCLERDYLNQLLDLGAGQRTAQPFFRHLHKGCVLFERLLKDNPTRQPQHKALADMVCELGASLDIPQVHINREDCSELLQHLQQADGSIQTAIEMTGKIRSIVAQNLDYRIRIDKQQYHQLFRMIALSCLHVIACLY